MHYRDDSHYYASRAQQERAMSHASHDPAVARLHLQLATEYDRRAATRPTRLIQS